MINNLTLKEWAVASLQFYSFTLIIPILITILDIIVIGVLGVEGKFGFWEILDKAWIGYYFNGTLNGIIAWRWQIVLILTSMFIARFIE